MPKNSTTQPKSDRDELATGLLTPEGRLVLAHIGAGTAPWSQRAQALLAVEEGATNGAAGEATGLRDTQVKYWVDAFRKKGMAIFPENILNGIDIHPGDSDLTSLEQDTSSAENKQNRKKSKKIKKSKKSKLSKGKKGKASKKKKRKGKKKKGRGKKKTK